jgi:hypothetical protein
MTLFEKIAKAKTITLVENGKRTKVKLGHIWNPTDRWHCYTTPYGFDYEKGYSWVLEDAGGATYLGGVIRDYGDNCYLIVNRHRIDLEKFKKRFQNK